jgi:hypothetical protein
VRTILETSEERSDKVPGLNIGAYQEAAEHLLSALSMQVATAGETSEQLWFTLRRVFFEMVSSSQWSVYVQADHS